MILDRSTTSSNRARAFTIVELLVVIGVIGILAALTTLGARRLTAGSRLAAATNAVTSALGNARAAAIKDGVATAVVFRPVWDSTKPSVPQRTVAVTVRSTGERFVFNNNPSNPGPSLAERWVPVDTIPSVPLSEGIQVAGPMYNWSFLSVGGVSYEQIFGTQANLRAVETCGESPRCSRMVAVMFGPDGQFLTRPPKAALGDMQCYVDWNRSGATAASGVDPQDVQAGSCEGDMDPSGPFWQQDDASDECNMMFVPLLAVYDDKAARELKGTDWGNINNLVLELTGPAGYIAQFGDKITFNRFSGIPERKTR